MPMGFFNMRMIFTGSPHMLPCPPLPPSGFRSESWLQLTEVWQGGSSQEEVELSAIGDPSTSPPQSSQPLQLIISAFKWAESNKRTLILPYQSIGKPFHIPHNWHNNLSLPDWAEAHTRRLNSIDKILHVPPSSLHGAILCQPLASTLSSQICRTAENCTGMAAANCSTLSRSSFAKSAKSDFNGTIFNNIMKGAFHNLVLDEKAWKASSH